jgi:hypothetical protein
MADARDSLDKIEEISKVSKAGGKGAVDGSEVVERIAPDKEQFDSLMRQDITHSPQQDVSRTNFMDQVRELNSRVEGVAKASPDSLIKQTHDAIAQIEEVKNKLSQPGVEIKGSVENLLNNKLSHIDENLKIALNRTGSEYIAPSAPATSTNPIERFLGFLTHGQYQLQKIAQEVNAMHLNKTEISPANMLAIQIKMGYVTQEIEFFTALLNKALESTKTIMNVQV